jgi:menaquinone-dependent protoporphyrinogen oxidase
MSKRILVAYASGSGSTREVAEEIAAEIEGNGLRTIVQTMSQVESINLYSGVILGSSIRIGRWLPEAVACLERIRDELADKQVAYFTTCLTMVDDTKENREKVLAYMQPLLNMTPNVKPMGLGLFAGSLDPDRQAIIVGDGPQGDYRDWEAIRAWAREIRTILLAYPGKAQLELAETVLSYTDMSYTDLSQVDLQGAELHSSYLVETNMEASHLEWADLSGSQMQGTNFFQANLIGSIMKDSTLKDANLAEATLNGAILQNANLSNANLTRADMNWVDLSGANLTKANLQQARLGWAKLTNANLEGAILTGARYNEHTIWPEGFSPEEAGCVNVGHGVM